MQTFTENTFYNFYFYFLILKMFFLSNLKTLKELTQLQL